MPRISGAQFLAQTLEAYGATHVFFVPTIDGYLAYQGRSGASLKPWDGFADYSKYLLSEDL